MDILTSNFEIYEGKSFKDLCKDICNNQSNRKKQIEILISDLRPMIKTANDALQLVPLIKEYIDASISNDEHLIKLAQICQKVMSIQTKTSSSATEEDDIVFNSLSEEEKKYLMEGINNIGEGNNNSSIIVKNISSSSNNK